MTIQRKIQSQLHTERVAATFRDSVRLLNLQLHLHMPVSCSLPVSTIAIQVRFIVHV